MGTKPLLDLVSQHHLSTQIKPTQLKFITKNVQHAAQGIAHSRFRQRGAGRAQPDCMRPPMQIPFLLSASLTYFF